MAEDTQVHIFPTKAELQTKIGDFIALKAKEAITDHGFFSIAFSGGSVASLGPAGLIEQPNLKDLQLSKWKIYFCDERYVNLSNEDSNYNMVKKNFLSKVQDIKSENVYKIDPSLSLEDAAKDYETKIKSSLGDNPRLDLLLIGMGPDGHICSLFPGHPLLNVTDRQVASISDSPKLPPQRITLTFPALNAAHCAMFIASGSGKADVAQKVLEGSKKELPAALVKLTGGTVHWFLDNDAASKLKKQ